MFVFCDYYKYKYYLCTKILGIMKHIQFNNLNSRNQKLVRSKYRHLSFDDHFIVYDDTDVSKDIVVFGYYCIEQLKITESRLYPNLLSANSSDNALSMTNKFDSEPCYCITEMELDADISKDDLVNIFNLIAIQCVNNKPFVFVWKEHKNKILYYPITNDAASYNGYPSMANYFADNF